jgi:hypothetical protein
MDENIDAQKEVQVRLELLMEPGELTWLHLEGRKQMP